MDLFSPSHRFFEKDMIEAKDVADKTGDGLVPEHSFTVLVRYRRNYASDRRIFLRSWR